MFYSFILFFFSVFSSISWHFIEMFFFVLRITTCLKFFVFVFNSNSSSRSQVFSDSILCFKSTISLDKKFQCYAKARHSSFFICFYFNISIKCRFFIIHHFEFKCAYIFLDFAFFPKKRTKYFCNFPIWVHKQW